MMGATYAKLCYKLKDPQAKNRCSHNLDNFFMTLFKF
jgi:hypothetical protein